MVSSQIKVSSVMYSPGGFGYARRGHMRGRYWLTPGGRGFRLSTSISIHEIRSVSGDGVSCVIRIARDLILGDSALDL